MDDAEVIHRISKLVDEEHELERSDGELDSGAIERLKAIEVQLDQCWDLLRRRRARRRSGEDPDGADVRDAETVERYLQ